MNSTMQSPTAEELPEQKSAAKRQAWKMILAGVPIPLGLAVAAAFTSYATKSERVATTAWVAVAVVGAASMISSAAAARHIYK